MDLLTCNMKSEKFENKAKYDIFPNMSFSLSSESQPNTVLISLQISISTQRT